MTNPSNKDIGYDPEFFKSTDGVFKVVQLLLVLLLFIFILASDFWGYDADYVGVALFVASFGLLTMIFSVVIYAMKLYNGGFLSRLPWKNVELYYAIASSILYFISMIVTAVAAGNNQSNGLFVAAAIFSVLVTISYCMYAFVIFRGSDPRSVTDNY